MSASGESVDGTESPAGSLPLAGIRVIDFTQVFMGPSCTQLLGDFGADVIKVERPGLGDISRNSVPDRDGQDNPIFLSINRNKRSISVDTKSEDGRTALRELIAESDVVVSNFRAGVMERMGFGYEELKRLNPRLIWASGTGFGPVGPHAAEGGQDVVIQAYSGVLWRRASDDVPLSVYPTTLCDYTTGMHLFQGILLALRSRDITGVGQKVEVAMYDSMLHMQMQEASMHLNRGREINWARMPLTGVFPSADSAVCIVGGFVSEPLRRISEALEIGEDLSQRPEFADFAAQSANRAQLQALFAERIATNTTAYWTQRLAAAGVLNAPVRTMAEALEDEQTTVNGMIIEAEHPTAGPVKMLGTPIHLSETPSTVRRVGPRLGEHNEEVLREYGFSDDRIRQLQEEGALR